MQKPHHGVTFLITDFIKLQTLSSYLPIWMSHINFAYRGRLDQEKGMDELIQAIFYVIKHKSQTHHTFQFHIWGTGAYTRQIQSMSLQYPDHLKAYGRKPLKEVKQCVLGGNFHYSLMPSSFLETFGLVALESCQWGLPIIGYAKGGLKQFIIADYDCSMQGFVGGLRHCITTFDHTKWLGDVQKVKLIASRYNDTVRYQQFHTYTSH